MVFVFVWLNSLSTMLSRSIHFFHQWKSFLFYDWLIFHCVCVTFFNPHICRWIVVVVHSLSHVRLCVTPSTAACQAPLSLTTSQSLLKSTSIESEMLSSHLIFCHPFLLLPSFFPSIGIFSNESVSSHQVAEVLEIQHQHQFLQWICWFPLELTGLISLL